MRRFVPAGAVVVALLLGPTVPAMAQAPAPRVTISGLADQVTSWSRNLSLEDLSYDRTKDEEWYARTRFRPDITAEVGKAKFVLGLEIDAVWGQTGSADSVGNRFGASGGWDINTDTRTLIEVKWGYTEFEMPWIPWQNHVRLGAQPFQATYKPAVLATGDFAGANLEMRASPKVKFNFTYAQIEEKNTGVQEGFLGEDEAIIGSIELSPLPSLDVRPLYAYLFVDGTTSAATRQGRGGVSISGPGSFVNGDHERRHTVGVDARWQAGGFYADPTVLYQWGSRQRTFAAAQREQDRSAWLVDVRGGWQAGPLLLEGVVVYTTGNEAKDDLTNGVTKIKYFEPIDTDTSYYAGWAEITALGVDYFNILYARASGLNPGQAIGYDKYGLIRVGFRPSYALTPTFTLRGAVTASWTDTKVDTDGTITQTAGLTPGDGKGNSRYLGTEIDLGVTWHFAANLTFDLVGGYLFAGEALASKTSTSNFPGGTVFGNKHPEDVQVVTARVRYTF